MSTTINWQTLTDIQQNALIAEKIFGWQWISYNFYDCSLKDQLWLLPDGSAVADLTPGEWIWYLEEEVVYPEGSFFPLPHKDKRIIPAWFPNYFSGMDTALAVLQATVKQKHNEELLNELLWGTISRDLTPFEATEIVCQWIPAQVCIACLRAIGCEVQS